MSDSLSILLLTTISIGFFHTIMGPDHYLPFIAMSKSGKWSFKKTIWITLFCGFGHVLSSVLLAGLVIGLGWTVVNLEFIEAVRGNIAGWLLLSFGLVYMIWGIKRSLKYKTHSHNHQHSNGNTHNHIHDHLGIHSHFHEEGNTKKITPSILFIIFVLGPCEPLIPILMYPALNNNMIGMVLVILAFTFITLITMMAIVIISFFGIKQISFGKVEKYTPAIAGITIFLCGFAILFLDL